MANRKDIKQSAFEFKPFSEKQKKLFTFWQDGSPMQDKFMVVADGSVRSGKEQPLDANVLTLKGFRKMGEIQVGDEVIARTGVPTKVINIYPQGEKDVWGITFSDGRYTECGKEHLWEVMSNPNGKTKPIVFSEILKNYEKKKHKNYLFPICDAVNFTNKIEPLAYVYGVILATGQHDKDYYMISTDNYACHLEIANYIPTYVPNFINGLGIGRIRKELIDKHFEELLRYSIFTRRSMLKGILDSRSDTTYKGTSIFNENRRVIDIIYELALSLGIYVTRDKYSPNHKLILHKDRQHMKIAKIEYVGKKECQCIEVEHESHTYLTDEYIVTHNTVAMSLSFVMFIMNNFDEMNAAICGKSVGAVRRNIVPTLKQMLLSIGYECIDHRSDNYLEIKNDGRVNYFWLFGGKDESSADQIQGITLAGLLLDEVVLMPQSFYLQATSRLSVHGAKCFVSCNPNSPYHWFYKDVLKNLEDNDGLYLPFTMEDNLSLSQAVRDRYEKMYSGVFYERFVAGKLFAPLLGNQ